MEPKQEGTFRVHDSTRWDTRLAVTTNGNNVIAHAGAATLRYGLFVNNVVNFVIVAFAIFVLVKQLNRFSRQPAAPEAPSTRECPYCAMGIPAKAKRCGHCAADLPAAA